MTSAQLVPAFLVPLVGWRIYVRVRRSIGRQPWQPKRMVVRIVILTLVSLLIGAAAVTVPSSLAALGGGLLLGVPLALVGLNLTRFERTPEGRFYTPNTFIGLALTLLLVGRMGYRVMVLYSLPPMTNYGAPALFQSPITLVMYGLTAGYYIAYYAGVISRGKKLAPAAQS